MRESEVKPPAPPESPHANRPLNQAEQLLDPRRAAVAADQRVLDAVEVEELDGLRVLTRRHLDLVAGLTQPVDHRPQHQHVSRRAHVDPDLHPLPSAG